MKRYRIVTLFLHLMCHMILLCCVCFLSFLKAHGSPTATFSPILSDDRKVPFAFDYPNYAFILYQNQSSSHLIPTQHYPRVREPFGGNPSGDVKFTILNEFDVRNSPELESHKLGHSFFVHFIPSSGFYIDNRNSEYVFRIQATFTSHIKEPGSTITLTNTSFITIRSLERNENCPFFQKSLYEFSISNRAPLFKAIGSVSTTDSDIGFNSQSYLHFKPTEDSLTFSIDPISGKIFSTQLLWSNYRQLDPHISPISRESNEKFKFNLYATHRGDKADVHCNVFSITDVEVNVNTDNFTPLSVSIHPTQEIEIPGRIGTIYARLIVENIRSPYNEINLNIKEPSLREKFALVRERPSEWLLIIRRNLQSISISSRIQLTVVAENVEQSIDVLEVEKIKEPIDLPVISIVSYRIYLPSEIHLNITESAIPGCTIAVIRPDLPYVMTNTSFVFTELSSSVNNSFPISLTSSGAVIINKQLNVDHTELDLISTNSYFELPFTVVDRNNLLLSSSPESKIVINIIDENDNDPIVRNNGSVFEVFENASLHTIIFQIDAFDPDLSNTELSYTLYNDHNLPFALSSSYHGRIIVSDQIDAETMPTELNLHVLVTDSGLPLPRSVMATFTIRIIDVNEHIPQFVENSCRIQVPVTIHGNLPSEYHIPFSLGHFSAEDLDRDGQHTVSINLAATTLSRPCFSVELHTGEITINCSHLGSPGSDIILTLLASDDQFVSVNPFELKISLVSLQYNDLNFSRTCNSSRIYQHIQDLQLRRKDLEHLVSQNVKLIPQAFKNRHKPRFPDDMPIRMHIPENLPIGTEILQFSATDDDMEDFSMAGIVVYGLEVIEAVSSQPGADATVHLDHVFVLRNVTDYSIQYSSMSSYPQLVAITMAAPIDRETVSIFEIKLHACDLGTPQFCSSVSMHIFIENIDDNSPVFLHNNHSNVNRLPDQSYSDILSVLEDVKIGDRIGFVHAIDQDVDSQVRYRLKSYNDLFRIHPQTGLIRLLKGLDREQQSSYELLVEAFGQSKVVNRHNRFLHSNNYLDLLEIAERTTRQSLPDTTATTRLLIEVVDINDNQPIFHTPRFPAVNGSYQDDGYHLFLPDDLPEGCYLTTLSASDPDQGRNALIGYSLYGSDLADVACFTVDQLTGVVRLAASCNLDLRVGRTLELTAWAVDHGKPQQATNTSFLVTVLGVHQNVYPPQFTHQPSLYYGWISENLPSGSLVLSSSASHASTLSYSPLYLEVADPEGASIDYVIAGGSGLGFFEIDNKGLIKTIRSLDAEALPEEGGYWLTVHAVETNLWKRDEQSDRVADLLVATEIDGPMKAIAQVFIKVKDVNDHYPIPSAAQYHAYVHDKSPSDVKLVQLFASDADVSHNSLHFVIASGDPQGHFAIDSTQGILRTSNRVIDRKGLINSSSTGLAQFNLIISISDQGDPLPKSCQVRVTLDVLPVRRNRPLTFELTATQDRSSNELPLYRFQLLATQNGFDSKCFGRVIAVSSSAPSRDSEDQEITYFIAHKQSSSKLNYTVDPHSGIVCRSLDVTDEESNHATNQFEIEARLGSETTLALVEVQIVQPESSSITTTTTKHPISFSQSPPAQLSIRSSRQPDPETALFTFSIDPVVDGSLIVRLTDPADPTRWHPLLGLGRMSTPAHYYVYLARPISDTPAHQSTRLLIQLQSLDVGGRQPSVNATTRIEIEPYNSQDPEWQLNASNRTVIQKPPKASNTLGQPEGPLIQLSVGSTAPTGHLIYQFNAGERDRSDMTYFIASVGHDSTRRLMHLDSKSGELRLLQSLTSTSPRLVWHLLLIGLRDSQSPSRQSFARLMVNVTRDDTIPPRFIAASTGSSEFRFYLSAANQRVGQLLGRVIAVEDDNWSQVDGEELGDSDNKGITYKLLGGNPNASFSIDAKTGGLRLASLLLPRPNHPIDASNLQRQHHLLVGARSLKSNLSSHARVTIQLLPGPGSIDAPPPRFNQSRLFLTLRENRPSGFVIAPLASYLLAHETANILTRFTLVNSTTNEEDLFAVSASTGLLATTRRLDRELHGDFCQLTVSVSGSYGLRAMVFGHLSIELRILDENDNTPQVTSPLLVYGSIREDAPSGTIVRLTTSQCQSNSSFNCLRHDPVLIEATDRDAGVNALLTYRIVPPFSCGLSQSPFTIDDATGLVELTSTSALDRERCSSHLLTVEVSDQGRPLALTALERVWVRVDIDDAIDTPPQFNQVFYTATIFLPSSPMDMVARLQATDADLNDTITYSLVDGTDSNHFLINPSTGMLRVSPNSSLLNSDLSFSAKTSYFVEFAASDSASLSTRSNITIFARPPSHEPQLIEVEPITSLELIEHFTSSQPLLLGRVAVRNTPLGKVYRFTIPEPVAGIYIDEFTGLVYASGRQEDTLQLDRESTPHLTLPVLVRDAGNNQGSGRINIRLLDVNDNKPVFQHLPYHATFCLSDRPVAVVNGEKLGNNSTPSCTGPNSFQVNVTDSDEGLNASLLFHLSSIRPRSEPPLLAIDSSSGRLTLARLLPDVVNWAGRQLEAVVVAVDGGGLSASATATIQLASASNGPYFDQPLYKTTVRPDQPGQLVLSTTAHTVSGGDASNRSLVNLLYRIAGAKYINEIEDDSGSSSIGDMRRFRRTWTSIDLEQLPFQLDFATGTIRVASPMNYTTGRLFDLVIEAIDTKTTLSARTHVLINVTDVNDAAPQFQLPTYQLDVEEDVSVGSPLLNFNASDLDTGLAGQVKYGIEPLNNSSQLRLDDWFNCNSSTGQLTLNRLLDYQQHSVYRFWAVASDQAPPFLTNRVPVTIKVIDTNNHPPQFVTSFEEEKDSKEESCHIRATINPASSWGSFVISLTAFDPDVNDRLSYRLLPSAGSSPSHLDYFQIDNRDGTLVWTPIRSNDGLPVLPSGSTDDVLSVDVEASDGRHTAKCQIDIRLLPMTNLLIPKFPDSSQPLIVVNVNQPLRPGLHIVQLPSAQNDDSTSIVEYKLVGGFQRNAFILHQSNRSLSVSWNATASILRLSHQQPELLIRACNQINKRCDFLTVRLTLNQQSSSQRPVFGQALARTDRLPLETLTYKLPLHPSQYNPLGPATFPQPTSLRLAAFDLDNNQLIYRLFIPPGGGERQRRDDRRLRQFAVDANSGSLLLTRSIDSRTASSNTRLVVEACQKKGALCSQPAHVLIDWLDWDLDPSLAIECFPASQLLLENDTQSDREVAYCRISSRLPSNFTSGPWQLISVVPIGGDHRRHPAGWHNPLFVIEPKSGLITSRRPLDFESMPSGWMLDVALKVALVDTVTGNVTSSLPSYLRTRVNLTIGDAPDSWPQLDSEHYQAEIPEDLPPNSRVLRVIGRDPDNYFTDPIIYSLWPTSLVTGHLIDVNDGSADIQSRLYNIASQLNLLPEIDALRQLFTITSDGWLLVNTELDFESSHEHNFSVVVSDPVGHWNSSQIIIHLKDVNDNPPHWPLESPSSSRGDANVSSNSLDYILFRHQLDSRQRLRDEIEVAENWVPPHPIYQLELVDPDQGDNSSTNIFFLLKSDENEAYSVFFSVSSSGAVQLRQPLDREVVDSVRLRFKASDGIFTTKDVFELTVRVTDVNDHSPICLKPERQLTVPEDTKLGTILTIFSANDSDASPINSVLSYRLVLDDESNASTPFSLNASDGTLRLVQRLDFESRQHYQLTVEASDAGRLSCSFTASLLVTDVNDHRPVFNPVADIVIPEDCHIESLIGKVTATDVDSIDVNRLTYSLLDARNASFSVEGHTGLIKVSHPLDREIQSLHRLTVLVTDGNRLHTASTSLTIRLTDVNDSPPQFLNASHSLSVSELVPVGSLLTRLEAVSMDEGQNAVVRYRLLTKQPEFKLNSTTGDLTLRQSLDHERSPAYFLTVEARDSGLPPLATTSVVSVSVEDANDNPPRFGSDRLPIPEDTFLSNATEDNDDFFALHYLFEVVENSRNGTVIGKLTAHDADSGINSELKYALADVVQSVDWPGRFNLTNSPSSIKLLSTAQEAGKLFHVNSDSGRLSLLFEPDRELVDSYWFAIAVSDSAVEGPLTSQSLVHVRVLDMNDCPPQFTQPSYEFVVAVDRAGKVGSCYEASDPPPSDDDLSLPPPRCPSAGPGNVLLGHLRITDRDAQPNSGPFTCQLTHLSGASSGRQASSSLLFSIRNTSADEFDASNASAGECLIYASDRLPIGSQSLLIRVNDNGLTALHSTVTVGVRVIRQANLPPDIVKGNATLTYYRSINGPPATSVSTSPIIARVNVKDRSTQDRLIFSLVSSSPSSTTGSSLFRIDQYDGSIRSVIDYGQLDALTSSSGEGRSIMTSSGQGFGHPLMRLDSGLYPLRVRVTNGSLTAEETLHIKVVTITDDMLKSAVVVRITNMLPNLFYIDRLDKMLSRAVGSQLHLPSGRTLDADQHVYLLSVQLSDSNYEGSKKRRKRSTNSRSIDVLLSAYNPDQRAFFPANRTARAVDDAVDSGALESDFSESQINVIDDLCTPQFCPRDGQCQTRISIDSTSSTDHRSLNRVDVHLVSLVSPRFSIAPTCKCPQHFAGVRCDQPLNACASSPCPPSKLCLPTGDGDFTCQCRPPRIGPNCESVEPVSGLGSFEQACYSEACFNQREQGPLQFTGGSFIHWDLVQPDPHWFDLSFSLRTRQESGPIASIEWSSLKSFQLRLTTSGRLVVSSTGLSSGLPDSDWLVSADRLSDGYWHRVRLTMASSQLHSELRTESTALLDPSSSDNPTESSPLQWWIELTVDGVNPRSTFIQWSPGDPKLQRIVVGSDLVNEFRPLYRHQLVDPDGSIDSDRVYLHPSVTQYHNASQRHDQKAVIRSGLVGCFTDLSVNRVKPPYQVNLLGQPTLLLKRSRGVSYGCNLAQTVSGACATNPCLHGGLCQVDSITPSSYSCRCPPLFHGRHCERTSDACLLDPCHNGGSCHSLGDPSLSQARMNSGLAAYRCLCPAGLSGLHCEQKQQGQSASPSSCQTAQLIADSLARRHSAKSSSDVCLNAGVCSDNHHQHSIGLHCRCPSGWSGARCEHDVDECELGRKLLTAYHKRPESLSRHDRRWLEKSRLVEGIYSDRQSNKDLCSPFESGRGVCYNLPGSYKCNCTLGFGGRYCETRTLIPLTADSNPLGLTQLHIYIIVGLLSFLFIAALTTIVLLVCRARGLLLGASRRHHRPDKFQPWLSHASKSATTGKLSNRDGSCCGDESTSQVSRFATATPTGIPLLAGNGSPNGGPRRLVGKGRPISMMMLGNNQQRRTQFFATDRGSFISHHRRPSVNSATFGVPVSLEGGGQMLVTGTPSTQRGSFHSNSSAAPTLVDYVDRDDVSNPTGSRLVLCPTNTGEAVPVVMMMSPQPAPHHHQFQGHHLPPPGCRTSVLPRYSPGPAYVCYGGGPGALSGCATPTNGSQQHLHTAGSSSYIGYSLDPPNGAYAATAGQQHPTRRLVQVNPHHQQQPMAFIPVGQSAAFLPPPGYQLTASQQHLVMRPNSVIGSDRISLGSGSDRFSSVNGSSQQLLIHPTTRFNGGSQSSQPIATPQPLRPVSTHVDPRVTLAPPPPSESHDGASRSNSPQPPLPPVSSNSKAAEIVDQSQSSSAFTTTQRPRPVPASMQHQPNASPSKTVPVLTSPLATFNWLSSQYPYHYCYQSPRESLFLPTEAPVWPGLENDTLLNANQWHPCLGSLPTIALNTSSSHDDDDEFTNNGGVNQNNTCVYDGNSAPCFKPFNRNYLRNGHPLGPAARRSALRIRHGAFSPPSLTSHSRPLSAHSLSYFQPISASAGQSNGNDMSLQMTETVKTNGIDTPKKPSQPSLMSNGPQSNGRSADGHLVNGGAKPVQSSFHDASINGQVATSDSIQLPMSNNTDDNLVTDDTVDSGTLRAHR